jgi:uncharacterized protein (TIGR01244 family)
VRVFAVIVLFSVTSVIAAQDTASSIRNYLRINTDFCTGGQPKMDELAKLKSDGIRTIINLRPPSEYPESSQEEKLANELGLRYFNIPVVFNDPKDEQVTEFLKLTDDPANRPAFIHCTAAIRAGAFWMIRRVVRDHWSLEDAQAEAGKVGLGRGSSLNAFVRKYVDSHKP